MDKIHHIAVQIEDVKSAVDWYSEQFDVEVTYQNETWAILKFDNISLAMVVPGRHPPISANLFSSTRSTLLTEIYVV